MRILPVVMTCAAFCGVAAATTFHGPVSVYVPVELTPEERREVEQRVCLGPHRLPVAYAMGRSTDKIDHSAMMRGCGGIQSATRPPAAIKTGL